MEKKMKFLKHLLIEGGIMTFIAFLLYVSLGHKILFFDEVQNLILDHIAFNAKHERPSNEIKDVVCVSINDSLKRDDILLVLQRIMASEPAVVGIDINFEEPEYTQTDTLLENFIRKNQSQIVLSYDWDKEKRDSYSFFVRSYEDYPYLGHVHAVEVKDMVRVLKLEDWKRPSFVSLLSKLYKGKELNDVDGQRLIINYNHEHTPIKSNLLLHQKIRDLLKGKVVIVGIEHQRGDLHYTPRGIENGYMIHFHALKSLLEYKFDACYRYYLPVIFIFLSVAVLFGVKYLCRRYYFINPLIDLFTFVAMVLLYLIYWLFLDIFDYTAAALWCTIPFMAVLALWIYSVAVILLGRAFDRCGDTIRKSYLYEG